MEEEVYICAPYQRRTRAAPQAQRAALSKHLTYGVDEDGRSAARALASCMDGERGTYCGVFIRPSDCCSRVLSRSTGGG